MIQIIIFIRIIICYIFFATEILTLSFVSAPTMMGETKPGMVPKVLVIPISVPAYRGDRSAWEQMNPHKLGPQNPTARHSITIASVRSQPTKQQPMRANIGRYEAGEKPGLR